MRVTVGQDVTVEELNAKYDGLFFGTGAWKQPILGIGGENLALFGLDFLTEVNTYLKKTIGRMFSYAAAATLQWTLRYSQASWRG
jgi:NADPH-dependent glutamate synthase beta subunit-like oxidoreductase